MVVLICGSELNSQEGYNARGYAGQRQIRTLRERDREKGARRKKQESSRPVASCRTITEITEITTYLIEFLWKQTASERERTPIL